MKYKIIKERNIIDLEREVNAAIERGWKPIGGICAVVSPYGGGTYLYQAMVSGDEE